MKDDIYTKAVLTVIAGCLLYFTVKDMVQGPFEVKVAGWPDKTVPILTPSIDVNVVGTGGVRFSVLDAVKGADGPPAIPMRVVR